MWIAFGLKGKPGLASNDMRCKWCRDNTVGKHLAVSYWM